MLLPLVTMVGMNIGAALGGVIFIEAVFGLPGLGGMFRTSILQRDLPVTSGVVMFMTIAIILLNLIVDLAYAMLDPRIQATKSIPVDEPAPAAAASRTAELQLPV